MKKFTIKLAQLAVLADTIEGVFLARVEHYRQKLRNGEKIEPITVSNKNAHGFYVLNDGNHRTLAHVLEEHDEILAQVDDSVKIIDLSWRWPRIAPLAHTIELMKSCPINDVKINS